MGSWKLVLKVNTRATMIRFILIFSVVIYFTDALSCVPCGSAPCEVPKCCPSGKLTLDACGCCPVCAKGEKETCGGPWNTSGNCVVVLNCANVQQHIRIEKAFEGRDNVFSHSSLMEKPIINVPQMRVKMGNPGALSELIKMEKLSKEKGQTVILDVQEQNGSVENKTCSNKKVAVL